MVRLSQFWAILLVLSSSSFGLVIETFGDSLTQGLLARTAIDNGDPKLVSSIMSDMSRFGISGDFSYLEPYGAVNDAWPRYLKDRLESESSVNVSVTNVARLMETAEDLERQVRSINFSSSKDLLAFFFTGHNNLCPSLNTSVEKLAAGFRASYLKALRSWDSLHEGAKAYVLPVGNVDEVFSVLNQYVWFEKGNDKYRCNDQWTLYFPYCRKFASLIKQGTIRQVLHPRIEAMNEALVEVVEEMNQTSKKNRFYFLKNLSQIDYTIPYFAVDCFHLSGHGQKRLAAEIRQGLVN